MTASQQAALFWSPSHSLSNWLPLNPSLETALLAHGERIVQAIHQRVEYGKRMKNPNSLLHPNNWRVGESLCVCVYVCAHAHSSLYVEDCQIRGAPLGGRIEVLLNKCCWVNANWKRECVSQNKFPTFRWLVTGVTNTCAITAIIGLDHYGLGPLRLWLLSFL